MLKIVSSRGLEVSREGVMPIAPLTARETFNVGDYVICDALNVGVEQVISYNGYSDFVVTSGNAQGDREPANAFRKATAVEIGQYRCR